MQEQKLRRTLKLHECVFYGVGSILGAGIYTIIGKVAGMSGNMLWLAFSVSALTALMTAFSYAELSSIFPGAGGEYIYAKNTFNKRLAVVVGTVISFSGIVSGATVSLGFAGYLAQFIDVGQFMAAAGITLLIFIVNASGIRQSSAVNIVFTLIEFAGLAFVIYTAWSTLGSVDYMETPPQGMNGILIAASLSYFAFLGFEEIVKLGEETVEPKKTIPRALFIACAIVIVIYILVALLSVSALPWQELAKSSSPLADIVKTKYGQAGLLTIAAIALFSTSNTQLSNMTGASRVMYDMSKENSFFRRLAYVHPKTKTPVVALLIIGALMLCFAAIGKIERVALIANIFIFLAFLLVNTATIVLRFKSPDMERGFRTPLNIGAVPIPSLLGILFTLLLMGYTIYALTTGIEI